MIVEEIAQIVKRCNGIMWPVYRGNVSVSTDVVSRNEACTYS
jgi:hypothetical protein